MTIDTNALHTLIEQVQPGWNVQAANYADEPRTGTVTTVTDAHFCSQRDTQGTVGLESYSYWPTKDDDFEVEGLTLRTYANVHGRRTLALTLVFSPPEAA